MHFLLLIYGEETSWAKLSKTERDSIHVQYAEFGKKNAGTLKGGNALMPVHDAKTVRTREGKSSTVDGPFAETKEQLGGYYLLDAPSIGEAVAVAAKIPGASYGCVEVRPIMTFS
jgi:hypothetical protein